MICGPYGGKKKILERTTVVLLRVLRQPEFKLRLLFSIEKRLHFFIKETVRAYPYIQTECNNIYTMRKLLYHTRVTALPTLKCRAEAEIEMHDVDVWKSEYSYIFDHFTNHPRAPVWFQSTCVHHLFGLLCFRAALEGEPQCFLVFFFVLFLLTN